MRSINIILVLILSSVAILAHAQTDRQLIRMGNRYFAQQNYAKAEVEYRKAVAANANNTQAIYNLGCALQAQQKDSAAIVQYEKAGKMETSKIRRSKSYHNIGVICQSRQMYSEAANAYKESLRCNPGDNETRYNYVLCKRLMKNQKQQNQKNKNNKDKNKDKQDKDKKQQDKNKDEKDKANKQPNQEQMSKDNAEQLLNAAIQEEKATQQRLKKAMQTPQRRKLQKEW